MLKINNGNNNLFNLTPHEIKIYRVEDTEAKTVNGATKKILKGNVEPVITLPSDGSIRLTLAKIKVDEINNIPIIKMTPNGYQGLPETLTKGDAVVVSGVTAGNIEFLADMNQKGVTVLTVGETVWSDDLKTVIGCLELSKIN